MMLTKNSSGSSRHSCCTKSNTVELTVCRSRILIGFFYIERNTDKGICTEKHKGCVFSVSHDSFPFYIPSQQAWWDIKLALNSWVQTEPSVPTVTKLQAVYCIWNIIRSNFSKWLCQNFCLEAKESVCLTYFSSLWPTWSFCCCVFKVLETYHLTWWIKSTLVEMFILLSGSSLKLKYSHRKLQTWIKAAHPQPCSAVS